MAGKIAFCLAICIAVFGLGSCNPGQSTIVNNVQDNTISCWATMEESGLDKVNLRVLLENGDGNVPTGARVLLQTPDMELSWVYFNSSTNMYESMLTLVTSGDYKILVQSGTNETTLKIPITLLSGSPDIITLQDATGIAAGLGQSLNASSSISMEWKAISGASVYKGTIVSGSITAYTFSSITNSCMIPPDTLKPNKSYNLVIEAQYIGGDPYLQKQHFYTFSFTQSPNYYFTLK